jgi:drug/metabolite transporter (DMT)-like permease
MARVVGIALVVVGIVLLIWGVQSADSLSSQFSEFFTGTPTDRSMWLIIAGVAAIALGGGAAALGGRRLRRA